MELRSNAELEERGKECWRNHRPLGVTCVAHLVADPACTARLDSFASAQLTEG